MKVMPEALRASPFLRASVLLENGDRMKQEEFHRRYEQCPEGVKFELIGGIVYMASPQRMPHGEYHPKLSSVLDYYASETPGVQLLDNTTTILGEESEPQPDLLLRIREECGGHSAGDEKGYLVGPPELVAEVAHSSRSIDLNQKKVDYERTGVLEYLVLDIEGKCIHWFHFPSGNPIEANRQGVYRSVVFPGLWIHERALIDLDSKQLREVIQQGLASREHAVFVKRLERARRGRK